MDSMSLEQLMAGMCTIRYPPKQWVASVGDALDPALRHPVNIQEQGTELYNMRAWKLLTILLVCLSDVRTAEAPHS